MKNYLLLVLFGSALALSACESDSTLNTKAIKEELNSRKIRRISESEIFEAAFSKGKRLRDTLLLLSEKFSTDNIDSLNQSSRLGAMQPVVDLLQQENKAEIKKIIFSDLQAKNLKDQEKEIFEAYQYNIASGLKVDDNVQLLDNYIFYAAPILKEGELNGMWSVYFDKRELVKGIE